MMSHNFGQGYYCVYYCVYMHVYFL